MIRHTLLSNMLILVSIRISHCCFYNGFKTFVKLLCHRVKCNPCTTRLWLLHCVEVSNKLRISKCRSISPRLTKCTVLGQTFVIWQHPVLSYMIKMQRTEGHFMETIKVIIANIYTVLTGSGTIRRTLYVLTHLVLRQTYEIGTMIITSILQVRYLR